MADIAGLVINPGQVAALLRGGEMAAFRQCLDLRQAIVTTDRAGALTHKLDTVVVDGIVAGGHHQAAVEATVKGGEVDFLCAALADPGHITPGVADAIGHRLAEQRAGEADIVADHNATGVQHLGKGAAHAVGHVFIDLVGNAATDVVGLEAG